LSISTVAVDGLCGAVPERKAGGGEIVAETEHVAAAGRFDDSETHGVRVGRGPRHEPFEPSKRGRVIVERCRVDGDAADSAYKSPYVSAETVGTG